MRYHVYSHNGKLAIASEPRSDYDSPTMGKTVWVSKHAFDPLWEGFTVEAGPESNGFQHWSIAARSGSVVSFQTGIMGEWVKTGDVRKPRRKLGAREWRWEAGQWVNHNPQA